MISAGYPAIAVFRLTVSRNKRGTPRSTSWQHTERSRHASCGSGGWLWALARLCAPAQARGITRAATLPLTQKIAAGAGASAFSGILPPMIPTLDRLSRIGQPRQRCRSAQDAAGALRRAVAGAAPIARRTLGGPGWRRCGHLLLALTPAPLPAGAGRPSPPSPLPAGEGRAAAGAAARLPLTRGLLRALTRPRTDMDRDDATRS